MKEMMRFGAQTPRCRSRSRSPRLPRPQLAAAAATSAPLASLGLSTPRSRGSDRKDRSTEARSSLLSTLWRIATSSRPTDESVEVPAAPDSPQRIASATSGSWPCSATRSRFSTGVGEIRAGWFKPMSVTATMEQLNRAHEKECFFTLKLEHTAAWKECYVECQRVGVVTQVNILSGRAASPGVLGRALASDCVPLYFPGFELLAVKLLFRCPGSCSATFSSDASDHELQCAAVRTNSRDLPLGFAVHMRAKSGNDLTEGERLARDYFVSTVAPAIGKAIDKRAARIESLLEGMLPGNTRTVEAGIPAIFDDRPGSQVVSIRFRSVAKSSSAPRCVELLQAPPGQVPQVKHVLFKSGDNPQQDRFALAMGRVFNHIWDREDVSVSVAGRSELVQNVLYSILQSGVRTAAIEVVAGSSPVRSFHDRHSKIMMALFGDAWWQGDLNDWVPSGPLMASAAAAFVTAYVLDIADRHQDNMLVTRDGRLFNIDFSYLFGEQPRLVDAKPFPVPVALRCVLIQNGPLWATFKAACVKALAALVKHREFVILQAIEISCALGSHFLMTRALTFGRRFAEYCGPVAADCFKKQGSEGSVATPGASDSGLELAFLGFQLNTLDVLAGEGLGSFVEPIGCKLSRAIDQGVYGHQVKDILHERRCVLM